MCPRGDNGASKLICDPSGREDYGSSALWGLGIPHSCPSLGFPPMRNNLTYVLLCFLGVDMKTFMLLFLMFEGLGICALAFRGEVVERQVGGENTCNQSSFSSLRVMCNSVFSVIQGSLLGNYYCLLQKGTLARKICFFMEHGGKPRNGKRVLVGCLLSIS